MKMTAVYRRTLYDLSIIRKKYNGMMKQKRDGGAVPELYELAVLSAAEIKKDLKRCKRLIEGKQELYDKLCRKALESPSFGEKDIAEVLVGEKAEYQSVFAAEILAKCAVVHKLAVQGEGNLNALRFTDFSAVLCTCAEEKLLERFEDFNFSDSETKMLYRRKVCENAEKLGIGNTEYIKSFNGKYIGTELFKRKKYGEITIALEIAAPLFICFAAALYTGSAFAGFLLYLPVRQIASAIIVRLSMKAFKTEKLPRAKKSFLNGENSKTLITVSMLLTDERSLENAERQIAKLYYSNCTENISLCILADLKSSETAENPEDEKILDAVQKSMMRINRKCRNGVTCCVRPRTYSKTQNEFMGRERKRGAIEELALFLIGEASLSFRVFGAELQKNVKYILSLDSDTDLTLGCAEELLRTAVHPVNCGRYGIFTMHTETDALCAASTVFTRLAAGDGGVTAYHSYFAERYQDIFGKSIFSGKGLINLEKFCGQCCNKFKSETVLSHDILEGELVGTAYVSDCQALELFPTNQFSYLKRLHRWVRGDWQNSVFVFSRRPFKNRGKNVFSGLSRFKLADNLRRSITPFSALACITASAFFEGKTARMLFLISAAAVMSNDMLTFLSALAGKRRGGFFRRFYSGNLPYGIYPAIRAALSLVMLPAEAFTGLDGAVRGLYRRLASKKNMLLWTTAQQGEKRKKTADAAYLLPNILSAVLLAFSPYPWARLTALAFAFDIPFAILSGKKNGGGNGYDYPAKKLIADARRMWDYYADFANEENNFLPPDNVQLSPVSLIARRTSPTDIGLTAASALAAYDMQIISLDELCVFLEKLMTSVEKLPKWYGNLYNWYDTASLAPLEPYFISSVDSGNFLCSLTALKKGLENINCKRTDRLAERIEEILENTDLKPFYNRKNGLMHIGYDCIGKKNTEACYGILMSEARMTSYYAVSAGQLPRKHWESLDRSLLFCGAFSGPASWTGTVFEFFMPEIFLPSYKNTLEYEGLKFCLDCQKRYARKSKIPFGISESGYYAFDENGSYLYKPHGVACLGAKRKNADEPIVSPYSSYLTLSFDGKASAENLERLRKLGMYGKYGFFEAADFSGGQMQKAESFMAHHLGMSILSIDNALNGNIMQKRFLADARMTAAESLLREKISNRPLTFGEKRGKRKNIWENTKIGGN